MPTTKITLYPPGASPATYLDPQFELLEPARLVGYCVYPAKYNYSQFKVQDVKGHSVTVRSTVPFVIETTEN